LHDLGPRAEIKTQRSRPIRLLAAQLPGLLYPAQGVRVELLIIGERQFHIYSCRRGFPADLSLE
jgi:hypothetical protein